MARRFRLGWNRAYCAYVARSSRGFSDPEAQTPPTAFTEAVESLRAVRPRPEVHIDETPAPKRLAPHAFAITADVFLDESDDNGVATGRLVLLYDPAGQEAWHGEFRLVTYIRAQLEPEMGADPLLLEAAWTWLTEAFESRGAEYAAASGTVTRSASEGFGGMAGEVATAEVEIRASWTPFDSNLTSHALAWGDALATAAGLAPLPPGVVPMPSPRSRQGT